MNFEIKFFILSFKKCKKKRKKRKRGNILIRKIAHSGVKYSTKRASKSYVYVSLAWSTIQLPPTN